MIIGEALRRLFHGLTIDLNIDGDNICRDVQFHYGDQKELIKWVSDRDKGNLTKYPLLWYVVAPYTEEPNDTKNVTSKLIIFQKTESHWFNTKRSVKSYDDIIEPTWKKVRDIIEKNRFIDVLGSDFNRYEIKDEPNYGVETDDIRLSQNDFSSKTNRGSESITIDIVDGRIIKLNFRIKTNCNNCL